MKAILSLDLRCFPKQPLVKKVAPQPLISVVLKLPVEDVNIVIPYICLIYPPLRQIVNKTIS